MASVVLFWTRVLAANSENQTALLIPGSATSFNMATVLRAATMVSTVVFWKRVPAAHAMY